MSISPTGCLWWQGFLLTAVGTSLEFKSDFFSHWRVKIIFPSPRVAHVIFPVGQNQLQQAIISFNVMPIKQLYFSVLELNSASPREGSRPLFLKGSSFFLYLFHSLRFLLLPAGRVIVFPGL